MSVSFTLAGIGTIVAAAPDEEEGRDQTEPAEADSTEGEGTEGIAEEEHEEFEAHHPWLPETKEIVFGGLAFLIVLAGLVKFAGPVIRKGLTARSDRIGRELTDASTARTEAESRAAQIRSAKGDIDGERRRILADADAAAERLLVEGRARLDDEVAELESRADAEIAGAGGRVSSELQAQVASMSLQTAERVVTAHLDAATQTDLIESFIARVGATGNGAGRVDGGAPRRTS